MLNLKKPLSYDITFVYYERRLFFIQNKIIENFPYLNTLTLLRMGFFGAAHRWHPSLKSVTHILRWWNLAQLYLTQRRSKKYMNHVTHALSSADISIFHRKSANFAISRNTDIDCILIYNVRGVFLPLPPPSWIGLIHPIDRRSFLLEIRNLLYYMKFIFPNSGIEEK